MDLDGQGLRALKQKFVLAFAFLVFFFHFGPYLKTFREIVLIFLDLLSKSKLCLGFQHRIESFTWQRFHRVSSKPFQRKIPCKLWAIDTPSPSKTGSFS